MLANVPFRLSVFRFDNHVPFRLLVGVSFRFIYVPFRRISLSAYGNTALHLVCDRGLVDNAKLLLEWGADVTMSNTAGAFPVEVWSR